MKTSNRTGIWIPREIECLDNLTITEKYLLSEIRSLTLAKGCFATNAYFAKLLGKKPDTISRIISKLRRLNLIAQKSFDGRRRELAYCVGSQSYAATDSKVTTLRPESNTDSESAHAAFVPCTTKLQKNRTSGNPKDLWNEFLLWASKLAPSTRERLANIHGPHLLEARDQLFWNNFQISFANSRVG